MGIDGFLDNYECCMFMARVRYKRGGGGGGGGGDGT